MVTPDALEFRGVSNGDHPQNRLKNGKLISRYQLLRSKTLQVANVTVFLGYRRFFQIEKPIRKKQDRQKAKIPMTKQCTGKMAGAGLGISRGSEVGEEIVQLAVGVRETQFPTQTDAGHADGSVGLPRDVGDLLGGHVELQEGA